MVLDSSFVFGGHHAVMTFCFFFSFFFFHQKFGGSVATSNVYGEAQLSVANLFGDFFSKQAPAQRGAKRTRLSQQLTMPRTMQGLMYYGKHTHDAA